jgi:uncharacterized protein (TIGR02996 family)
MTDRAAFIAAIRAAPNDDAPRLVFADWLQENGEEGLADFIRHSIETKDTPRRRRRSLRAFAPQADGLKWNRIWYCDRIDFREIIPPVAGIDRGLTTIVWMAADEWLAHAHAIFGAHPVSIVVLATWPRIVPSPPPPGVSIEGRRFRLVPREVVRPADLQKHRSEHPRIGLLAARDRLTIPYLLAAEWPGVDFRLPDYWIDPHSFRSERA